MILLEASFLICPLMWHFIMTPYLYVFVVPLASPLYFIFASNFEKFMFEFY